MEKPVATRSDPEARKAYSRWHYHQNKPQYKARARAKTLENRSAVRSMVLEYLRSHPCLDCGESDPIVLEFDHRAGVEKAFNVGDAIRLTLAPSTVIAEMEKCDVRCANCHRRKTYRERGHRHRG